MSLRIKKIFTNKEKKLATFVTGGDPNIKISQNVITTIAKCGVDIIEIGMPFSDPMADGPTIQESSLRSINSGTNLDHIFLICKNFRARNNTTPLILMGYYNVVFNYGIKKFVKQCKKNAIDGLIIVDLQPEEDSELLAEIKLTDINLIRLITPTTDKKRLSTILKNASGFLYYVTITGITGQHSANIKELKKSIHNIKKMTNLPILAGFGIKNEKDVKEICKICDGAVVGSSIVKIIEKNKNNNKILKPIENFVRKLKKGAS